MSKLRILLLMVTAALVFAACDEESKNYEWTDAPNTNVNRNDASGNYMLSNLAFPKVKGGTSEVIMHSTSAFGLNYAVEWDHVLRAQRWTCYYFCPSNTVTKWARGNWKDTPWGGDPFQLDPLVPKSEQPPVKGEFSGSYYPGGGRDSYYNRGHICASQDRMCSQEVNEQTFYMTNMMPQVYAFNGGIWADMEMQVRSWNKNSYRDTLFVVKGGTIDNENQILDRTRSGFIVPKYFFMALLRKKGSDYYALGFWAEHLNSDHSGEDLGNYVVNIRDLEQKTGIDFFCNLPDNIENREETKDVETIKTQWGL